jgi:hypothetical protein
MTKLIFSYRNLVNAIQIDVSHIKLGSYRNLYSANKIYDLLSLYACLPLVHFIVLVLVSCLGISNVGVNNVKNSWYSQVLFSYQ